MRIKLLSYIFALTAPFAAQASTLTTTTVNGAIAGPPGGVIGWGFTLTSDPGDWISVVTSSLIDETDPSLGVYTDFIGLEGGPVNALLAPADQPLLQEPQD